MAAMKIQKLTKSFGVRTVFKDVSFELKRGERWPSSAPTARASRRFSSALQAKKTSTAAASSFRRASTSDIYARILR